jgi:hypothetical protein
MIKPKPRKTNLIRHSSLTRQEGIGNANSSADVPDCTLARPGGNTFALDNVYPMCAGLH